MTKSLRRWLTYILVLVLVLFLCWQNVADSGNFSHRLAAKLQTFLVAHWSVNLDPEQFHFVVRKIGHGLAFLGLSFLGHLAVNQVANSTAAVLCSTIGLNLGVALLAELFQVYAPGRWTTPRDAAINLSGAILGIFFGAIYEQFNTRRARFRPHARRPHCYRKLETR